MLKLMYVEGYAELLRGHDGKLYWHIDGTSGCVNCPAEGYDTEQAARIDMDKAFWRYQRSHYNVEYLRAVPGGEVAVWTTAEGVYGYAHAYTANRAAFVCRMYNKPSTAESGVLSDVQLLRNLINY